MDALINSGFSGDRDLVDFAAQDSTIASLYLKVEIFDVFGLSFEPETDGGSQNLADKSGADGSVRHGGVR